MGYIDFRLRSGSKLAVLVGMEMRDKDKGVGGGRRREGGREFNMGLTGLTGLVRYAGRLAAVVPGRLDACLFSLFTQSTSLR